MEVVKSKISFATVTSITCTVGTYLFGEWETGLQILLLFMVLDTITGVVCAYKDRKLSSQKGYDGLYKKFMVLIILMLAVGLDRMIGQGWAFRTLVIYFYMAMEGVSIIENATRLGLPVPENLVKALEQLQKGNKKEIVKDDRKDKE